MKKNLWALLLCLMMVLIFAGCADPEAPAGTQPTAETVSGAAAAEAAEETEPAGHILTHAEYLAAPLDAIVTIETYVQGCQTWWDNKISLFCQSPDGGYFLYNMACSEADAAKLVPGTRIRVTGIKAEYKGLPEIIEGSFTFAAGSSFTAQPIDMTALLGSPILVKETAKLVSFKNLTIAPSTNEEGKEAAFLYKEDGSGEQGDSLYFRLTDGTNTIPCTVSRHLLGTGEDSEVYQAAEQLKLDKNPKKPKIWNVTGFLHWQDGPLLLVTSLTEAPK